MIKVGFLLSYDYVYLETSIPLVYDLADEITLAIDKDRLTWSGNKIDIPDSFFNWINQFDVKNKIRIYEDSFYIPTNTATQNDTRERNMLAKFMGDGGWHIQLDSDEYFVNFDKFVKYLDEHKDYLRTPEENPVQIVVFWVHLFRKVDGGFLYIKDSYTPIEIGTNYPSYEYMRVSNYKKIVTPFYLFHQSWARDSEEIRMKISNWSHKDDVNNADFFNFWKTINLTNYREVRNFHLTDPKKWKSLDFVATESLYNLPIEINRKTIFKVKLRFISLQILRKIIGREGFQKIKKIYQKYMSRKKVSNLTNIY